MFSIAYAELSNNTSAALIRSSLRLFHHVITNTFSICITFVHKVFLIFNLRLLANCASMILLGWALIATLHSLGYEGGVHADYVMLWFLALFLCFPLGF